MEILFELLVEIVFEVFAEGFFSLWVWIFPGKPFTEKGKNIVKVICVFVSLIFLVALVVGIILLGSTQGKSFWGWLFICLNIIYLLVGITLKVLYHIKK